MHTTSATARTRTLILALVLALTAALVPATLASASHGDSDVAAQIAERGYYTINDGADFTRYEAPQPVVTAIGANTAGTISQLVAAGDVTVSIGLITDYADSGFYVDTTLTLEELGGIVVQSSGDHLGLNLYFDEDADGEFLAWGGDDIYDASVGGDSYVLGAVTSVGGVVVVDAGTSFSGTPLGNLAGTVGGDTPVAVWVGVCCSGTLSATITSLDVIPADPTTLYVDGGYINEAAAAADGHIFGLDAFETIQAAIDAATAGDTIDIAEGDYALGSTLNIDQADITISGAGEASTTIDASGVSGYGVLWTADNVAVSNLTLLGPTADVGTSYGFKIQAPNDSDTAVKGLTLTNVTVEGSGRSEIDLNFAQNVTLTDVTVDGTNTSDPSLETAGVGVGMISATNVKLDGLTTLGNAWGAIGVFTNPSSHYDDSGAGSGLEITGLNATEATKLYGQGSAGGSIDGLDAPQFTHTVRNDTFRTGGPTFTFYQQNQDDAVAFAVGLEAANGGAGADQSTVQLIDDPDTFVVGNGMSIQTAIDAAAAGNTIQVLAGTYDESVTIDKPLTLLGAGSDVTTIAPSSGHAVSVAGHTAGEINGVTVQGFTLAPDAGLGFIALSGTVDVAPTTLDLTLDDVHVDGQIILNAVDGATFNEVTVENIDGVGDSGALELTGVADLAITNSTFSGNELAIRLQSTDGLVPADAYGNNGAVSISGSSFTGNAVSIENGDEIVIISATDNWWGSAAGPVEGDVVGEVDTDPWCVNPTCTTPAPDPEPEPEPTPDPDQPPGEVIEEVVEEVTEDETVSTDPEGEGPTADNPVVSEVTTPTGGTVEITVIESPPEDEGEGEGEGEGDGVGAPSGEPDDEAEESGFRILDFVIDIEAPPATPEEPLVLDFQLDESLFVTDDGAGSGDGTGDGTGDGSGDGTGDGGSGDDGAPSDGDVAFVQVFRNGVPVATCADPDAGVAEPDPCVIQSADGGIAGLTVLTSQASVWTFATITGGCPAGLVPEDDFGDVATGAMHESSVDCLDWWGLTDGIGAGQFGPTLDVTRGQMASFVARLLSEAGVVLADDPADQFGDDDTSVHELAINQLAAAGVVEGVSADRFVPGRAVTRAETATMLVNAYATIAGAPLPAGPDAFGDDDGSVHADNIDAAAAAGITEGVTATTFAPAQVSSRGEMASLLVGVLDVLVADGIVVPPIT